MKTVGLQTESKPNQVEKELSLMQKILKGPDVIELDFSDEYFNFKQPKKKTKS